MFKTLLNALNLIRKYFYPAKTSNTGITAIELSASKITTFIKKTRAKIFRESLGYEFQVNNTGLIDTVEIVNSKKNIVSGRLHSDLPMGQCTVLGKPSTATAE